jgi:DNA helicase-2/ATP-dependent DNA helicase PcrA
MINYEEELNGAQLDAVRWLDGPSLVIAGAGSGKTRVLTYKIAYLLENGYEPWSILALTFTNKAAGEMKERIAARVGERAASMLWMGTFHSVFSKILRREAFHIGYDPQFTIYDQTDSRSLVKSIIKEMQLDDKVYKPNAVAERISAAKSRLISASDYENDQGLRRDDLHARIPSTYEIYKRYAERCRLANAMDFDDLLVNTYRLFRDFPDVLDRYVDRFRYVLVDEYQDTNYVQGCIVWQLTQARRAICVVGDDAQSIYSFRGANIGNILGFTERYEGARIFKLEQNYRSTKMIVNAANSLIARNREQIKKTVFSDRGEGEPLALHSAYSDFEEGEIVANKIADLRRREGLQYSDFAVLYRTNAQSRVIEDELRHMGIPYRIYGGMSFYQRKEIKDAIAYFRLAVNPHDNEAFARVINYPLRGIGETTVMKVREASRLSGCSMMEVICNPEAAKLDVSAATQKKFTAFAEMINRFSERVATTDAYEFASDMLRDTGVMREAKADTTQEGKDRLENLEEMLAGIHEFVDQRLREDNTFVPMTEFLSEVSLLTDQDEKQDDNQPRITLLTVHAAKGLEFKVTFIVGLEENLFPSQFCQAPKEIEEERRLLYVAITRAMECCYLTNARQRFRNGQTQFSSPSRFLKDIDTCYVQQTQAMSSFMPQPIKAQPVAKPSFSSSSSVSSSSKLVSVSKKVGSSTTKTRKEVRSEWKKQDRVVHKVFGAGLVLDVYHENDNDKIDIQFDNVGKKTLLLTYAKLTRE